MNISRVSQVRGIFCGFFLEKKYFTNSNNGDELISGCFFPHESPSHVRTEGFWWRCAHPGDAPPALLLLSARRRGSLETPSQPCPVLSCLWPWGAAFPSPPTLQGREGSPSSEALLEHLEEKARGRSSAFPSHPKGSAALQGSPHALPLAAAPVLGAARAQRGRDAVPRVWERWQPRGCAD